METKNVTKEEKADYEKPVIKEEIALEQNALACTMGQAGRGNKDCTKPPTTPGSVLS
jgi:hypothetical protein